MIVNKSSTFRSDSNPVQANPKHGFKQALFISLTSSCSFLNPRNEYSPKVTEIRNDGANVVIRHVGSSLRWLAISTYRAVACYRQFCRLNLVAFFPPLPPPSSSSSSSSSVVCVSETKCHSAARNLLCLADLSHQPATR